MTPLDKLNAIEEALRNLLYVFGTDDNDKPLPLDKSKTLGCIVDGYGAKALIPQLRQDIERLTAEPSEAEMISNTLKSREDRLINKFKSQEYCHGYIERYIELRLSAFLRAASKKHSNSLDMTIREILRLALADGKVVICQVVTASEFIKLTQILEGAALGKLAAEPSDGE